MLLHFNFNFKVQLKKITKKKFGHSLYKHIKQRIILMCKVIIPALARDFIWWQFYVANIHARFFRSVIWLVKLDIKSWISNLENRILNLISQISNLEWALWALVKLSQRRGCSWHKLARFTCFWFVLTLESCGVQYSEGEEREATKGVILPCVFLLNEQLLWKVLLRSKMIKGLKQVF